MKVIIKETILFAKVYQILSLLLYSIKTLFSKQNILGNYVFHNVDKLIEV